MKPLLQLALANAPKLAGVLCLCFVASGAQAATDCERVVKNIYHEFGGFLQITFADGGSAIRKNESQISAVNMSRLLAVAMAAQTTGRPVRIRYPEDGIACPPTGDTARTDFVGYWLTGP